MSLIFRGDVHTPSQFYDRGPYSNHANQATAANQPSIVSGLFGSGPGYNFDGSAQPNNDHFIITAAASINSIAQMSGLFWVMFDTAGADVRLFDKKHGTDGGKFFYRTSTNTLNFTAEYDGGVHAVATSTDTLSALVPYCIGFTWEHGSAPKLFINGKEPAYGTQTAGTGALRSDSAKDLWIGSQNVGGTPMAFDGKMGSVRMWNTAKTVLEFQRTYSRSFGQATAICKA